MIAIKRRASTGPHGTVHIATVKPGRRRTLMRIRQDWQLYLFLLPAAIYFFIFAYLPMYGIQVAFRDYSPGRGITGSPWVGLEHFQRFFTSNQFGTVLLNSLELSLYSLLVCFPLPIIFALMITQMQNMKVRKTIQTITYAPHFISIVVVVGMLNIFLSPRSGIVNTIVTALGGEAHNFMGDGGWFKHLYVISDVWQSLGWSSIIYVAALSAVSPELYEAADLDGASRFQKVLHIDLPSVIPTAVILLIMNCGRIMSQGAEKAYLMQNAQTASSQELIATYVYKMGLINNQYSYSTAIGLFNSLINIVLLVIVNTISKRLTENSLW